MRRRHVNPDYRDSVLDGLVAYWRLGEAAGTVARDEMGRNHLDYTNTPTLGVAGALAGDANTGVAFASASLQRAFKNGCVVPIAGNSPFTMLAWAKTSTAANQDVLAIGQASGSNDAWLRVASTGGLSLYGHTFAHAFGGSFADGVYHLLAITYDGTLARAFGDSVQVGAAAAMGPYTFGTHNINIGLGNAYFNGSIDEVRVYNRALTAAEIAQLYRIGMGR